MSSDRSYEGIPFPSPKGSPANVEFRWLGSAIDERNQSALNVGAHQCSSLNHMPCDTLDYNDDPDHARTQIKEWWGITGTIEARQTVGRLLDGMHSTSYEVVFPLVEQAVTKSDGHTADAHRDFLALRALGRGQSPDHWVSSYNALSALRTTVDVPKALTHPSWPEHIRAWDFARLPYVVRVARRAGYLLDDECWTMLHANLEAARSYYPNWRQFGHGVIVGRMYWCALSDPASATEYGQAAANAINAMYVRPDSPWRRLPLQPAAS